MLKTLQNNSSSEQATTSQDESFSYLESENSRKRPSNLESENSAKRPNNLDFYGKTEESQEANIRAQLLAAFKDCFHDDIEEHQIHNYYFCKYSKCHDISSKYKNAMTKKDNKFQHKWIFDHELAKCKETGIWSLTYIDRKGMFCNL